MEQAPRWMDVDAAARHVSMRADLFLRAVAKSIIPAPSYALGKRSPRWDRDELDAKIKRDKIVTSVRKSVDGVVEEIQAEGRARRKARAA